MAWSRRARGGFDRWPAYVPAHARRARAARELAALKKRGKQPEPVVLGRRAIATTFWGKAWCDNLERYSDFANRLPRGRTYARQGSILDLKIGASEVRAAVSGTEMYDVRIRIAPVPRAQWNAVVKECAGKIDSVIELLRGELSNAVMTVLTRAGTGLFPRPAEIEMTCSCPDVAVMCKHVAATLYGTGARLDEHPELLFVLRGVQMDDLVATAARRGLGAAKPVAEKNRVLDTQDLSALFGIELQGADAIAGEPAAPKRPRARAAKKAR